MGSLSLWRAGWIAILMLLFGPTAAQERLSNPPLSESQARELLSARLQADGLYGPELAPDCLKFYTERRSARHFDFIVTARDEERCAQFRKPDAKVDEFRVLRDGSDILWYSNREGGFVEFTLAKEHRKPLGRSSE